MLKISLLLFCFFSFASSFAQFSEAQKDSVLAKLSYNNSAYQLFIGFRPADYQSKPQINPYKELSDKEVLEKLSNRYTDASVYQELCIRYFSKNEMPKAEEYFNKAVPLYENWVNEETKNTKPLLELMDLLLATKTYSIIDKVLLNALEKFPQDKDVLEKAIIIYLDIFKDFDKTQYYINQLLAVEPYNLSACTYQIMIYDYQLLVALNQNKTDLPKLDISIAEKALNANPKNIAYQHLYHFARVLKIYMEVMTNFLLTTTDKSSMDYANLFKTLNKPQQKVFEEAYNFFKKNIDKAPKTARESFLNTLGFIALYLNKNKESKKYFQTYYDETKNRIPLESLILINFIEKNWKETEKFVQVHIEQFNELTGYASLIKLYEDYDKNANKAQEVIKKVEAISTSDPNRSLILATWYLKHKNIEKASFYCDLLDAQSPEALWRNLALNVLKGDTANARKYLDTILQNTPNEKDALQLKKILNL
ncbi:MAG: hypothetical protein SFU27_03040 [Thermonemataceae bacterium]|nr:hypothetical protein [Thermonemataceae bacterium]